MKLHIRKAVITDCAQMMELIRELAVFEKAPDAVTVTLEHFTESRFWKKSGMAGTCGSIPVAGRKEEKLVGISLCYIRYSTWKGSVCTWKI